MCGILGYKGRSTPKNLDLIYHILAQAQIRGKHATGVSYLVGGQLKTVIEPLPSKEFLNKHFTQIVKDLSGEAMISLIGHTRYSTSGLAFNQPIFDQNLSIAMNGVVTQSDPSNWKAIYGFEPQTTNDSEIVHRFLLQGLQPLTQLGTASMATVGLWSSGKMFAFRNARRPAWKANTQDSVIVTSTADIIARSIGVQPTPLKSGTIYQFSPGGEDLLERETFPQGPDLQEGEWRSDRSIQNNLGSGA